MDYQLGRFWYWITNSKWDWLNFPIFLLTALTAIFAAVSVYIIIVQLRLMKRQTAIMQKQDEILNRRAHLIVVTEQQRENPQEVGFYVKNTGTKTARDFYLHLLIPTSVPLAENLHLRDEGLHVPLRPQSPMTPIHIEPTKCTTLIISGHTYARRYARMVSNPLYPTRHTNFAIATLIDPPTIAQTYRVFWKTVCENEAYPAPEGDFEALEITITPNQQTSTQYL